MLLLLALIQGATIDLSRGPIVTTNVAVDVRVDSQGRVISCRTPPNNAPNGCRSFAKGTVVASPLRRNGKPVSGRMTVSTTTVVSPL